MILTANSFMSDLERSYTSNLGKRGVESLLVRKKSRGKGESYVRDEGHVI